MIRSARVGEREDLSGRKVGGAYLLRERIAEGGFGDVYRSDQPLLGREVVVKVLHRRLRRNDVLLQRFMREAQLASRLDHPYAAHIYAFDIEPADGLFWIAMEMVQGITLSDWLKANQRLPLEQLVGFFQRVAEVVKTAHDRGIVHRDLKPSNVMLIERAGQLLPKLLDFGIAKPLDGAGPETTATAELPVASSATDLPIATADGDPSWVPQAEVDTLTSDSSSGRVHLANGRLTGRDAPVGTPSYMSPEQWNDPSSVGPASDLYALGVIAYEALTGRQPFHGATLQELVELHRHAPVPPLGDGFPSALAGWFERALAKRPEDRWTNALELAAAFRAASGLGEPAANLPRLDDDVRTAWLASAPEPLAELVAALDGARNAYQARDVAHELIRGVIRYLVVLALATRAQVREDRGGTALVSLVRTMRRRDLSDGERVELIRLLVRPLASRRGAHPLPELVDLVTLDASVTPSRDGFDPILPLHATADHSASTEDVVRQRLAVLVPAIGELLRRASFVLRYPLIAPRGGAGERWTGRRQPVRALVEPPDGEPIQHPVLFDDQGWICVDLWPLVQRVQGEGDAEPALFIFDGLGQQGARLVSLPSGAEHADASVWDWIASHVLADPGAERDSVDDGRPPYLGLMPFSTRDAPLFVGREAQVEAFVERLARQPLLVVVGSSGAGKSSFIQAGVIPALPPGWRSVTIRPGAFPLEALTSRLVAADLPRVDLAGKGAPAALAAALAKAAGTGTIAVVFDQLEELFTLCTSADERDQLAQVIAQLAAAPDATSPIRVICAIRADFLMQLEALAPLRGMLSPAVELLGNPSRDALVRIVVEPAERAGYALSDGKLADDMVDAVANRQGALALVSFTASRLWTLRDRRFRELTRKAYDAMGGVGGALGHHADATLDRMSPDQQRIARQIFRNLVTAEGTRTQIARADLSEQLATPRAGAVIDQLIAARLIAVTESAGRAHVELIHEALISAWPRLAEWMREDVEGAAMRDQIREAARAWNERGRRRGQLWHSDALVDLERWLRRPIGFSLSQSEKAFVEASRRGGRRARRVRRAVVLIAFVVVAVFAAFQYQVSQELAAAHEQAKRQSYAEHGRKELSEGKLVEALAYLDAARRRGDDSPSTRLLTALALQPFLPRTVSLSPQNLKPSAMRSAMFSPDGRWIVTTDDQAARVWNAGTGAQLEVLAHGDNVYDAVFAPDGTLVTASGDGAVRIWNLATGALVRMLAADPRSARQPKYIHVAISPDGGLIAANDRGLGIVHVWAAGSGALLGVLQIGALDHEASLAFSADGRWLAANGSDGARVFDARTWQRTVTLDGPQLQSFAFAPTGELLATADQDGDVAIWSVSGGALVRYLQKAGDAAVHVSFSASGALVLATTQSGTVQIWNVETGGRQSSFKSHRGAIAAAEFDATERSVVSIGNDGTVVVSDATTGIPLAWLAATQGPFIAAHFDPTSQRVIAVTLDGTARIWNLAWTYLVWSSPALDERCEQNASATEDHRFVAVGCSTSVYIWDTQRKLRLASLPVPAVSNGVLPAISFDGTLVAVAVGDAVELHRLPDGQRMRTIQHPAAVTSVAFGRAGRDLISGSVDGTVQLTREGSQPVVLEKLSGSDRVDAVGFAGDRMIIAYANKRLAISDLSGARVRALGLPGRARSFRVSADTTRLIVLAKTGAPAPPVLVDIERGQEIAELKGFTGLVFAARFVRGDREILTAGTDGARRWDGTTGRLLRSYLEGSTFMLDATVDPSNALLVTAGDGGLLQFWDLESGAALWALQASTSAIAAIDFAGTEAVTRDVSGQVARWKLPVLPDRHVVDGVTHCIGLRFDEDADGPVEQPPCDPATKL